jgi:hypothetical protein
MNGLLDTAIRAISDNGAEIVSVVDDKLQGRGKTHAVVLLSDEMFSLRAKEYRYKERSSFGLEQVKEAANEGHTLLSYIKQMDAFFVFDAEYVLRNGSTYEQASEKSENRTWIEVDEGAGTLLASYLSDEETPKTLAGGNATLGAF